MLRAPFPWFGGKSRCAPLIWSRFGAVPNYVEPFFGSGAVLLQRPHPSRTETVNDRDCYLSNFWRATQQDPEAVAHHADWPVNEADLHARHRWLVAQTEFRERMLSDPDYCDARIAGWWVWGISQWIGSGWCARPEWMGRTLPGQSPRGIHAERWKTDRKRIVLKRGNSGVHRKMTYLPVQMPDLGGNSGATGKGVHRSGLKRQLPQLSGDGSGAGRGILRRSVTSRMGQWQTRPYLTRGNGVHAANIRENLTDYMVALRDRLRCVRVCCGDWKRIMGPSPTTCIGLTGVFLDPPYSAAAERDSSVYSHDDLELAHEVREWAVAHGDHPQLRIALCGYEGEHRMPRDWECVPWKANGGYGNQSRGRGRANAGRERIWFSPHCRRPEDLLL
jgi:hypothetical protein